MNLSSLLRKERWALFLGPLLALAVYGLPLTLELTPRKLASILVLVGTYWILEPVPLAAAALLGVSLCIFFGIDSPKEVLAPFAHPLVFLLMGSFFIAKAASVHGLDRKMADRALRFIGMSPLRALLGLGVLTAFVSMWMANTATAALMLPVALGLVDRLRLGRDSASGFLLTLAYAASVGGLGTPVGTPTNLVGIGFIEGELGTEISFFKWMGLTVPMVVVMLVVLFSLTGFGWGKARAPGREEVAGATGGGEKAGKGSGETSTEGEEGFGRRNVGFVFGLAVFLWFLPGLLALGMGTESPVAKLARERLDEAVVGLLAGSLLFLLPTDRSFRRMTLTWREAAHIDWGTVLLFGGGLALGEQMLRTGLAQWVGGVFSRALALHSLWGVTALAIVLAIVLSEFTSNTASATMVVPIAIALAREAGVSPLPPALGASIGASFGFCLPVSTPPNAIVYGCGLVPLVRMMRTGIVFDVVGFLIIWTGLRILCPIFKFV